MSRLVGGLLEKVETMKPFMVVVVVVVVVFFTAKVLICGSAARPAQLPAPDEIFRRV